MRALVPLFLTALFVSFPLGIGAAVVEVTIDVEHPAGAAAEAPVEVAAGALLAEPLGGLTGSPPAEPFEVPVSVPGATRLEVPPGSVWRLRVKASGLWSPKTLVTAPGERESVVARARLGLVPEGIVEGRLAVGRGEQRPEELSLRFGPANPEPGTGEEQEEVVWCEVTDDRFSCQVPAGYHDLRVRAPEFVSHFYWGRRIAPQARLDLGRIELVRGASVVGRVEAADGELSAESCRVKLAPLAAGRSRGQRSQAQERRLALETKVTPRGFFSFEGVLPGSYIVTAEQRGFAPARIFPVTVMADAETEVREALLLERPVPFEISLQPPVDPWDRPWAVKVLQRSEIPGGIDRVSDGQIPTDGTFRIAALPPGKYSVQIEDSVGSRIAWEDTLVVPGQTTLHIDIPLVWIEGTLLLGEEPLAASITFGSSGGVQKVELVSDDEGRFFGVLPRDGEWAVDVSAREPAVHRTLQSVEVKRAPGSDNAELELVLPDVEITGEVVDALGRPVPGAVVRVLEKGEMDRSSMPSGEDGEFSIWGTAEGEIALWAEDTGRISEEVHLRIDERNPPGRQRLVLEERRKIRGQIVAAAGGVPGAVVRAIAFDAHHDGAMIGPKEARAGVDSRFQVGVPAGAGEVQVTAFPPGYTLTLLRLPEVPEEPVVVPVHAAGGTVVFDLGEEIAWERAGAATPVLFHNGMIIGGPDLRRWAQINGQFNEEPSRFEVPMLPPGSYHACLMGAGDMMLPGRPVPRPGTCVEGTVSPGSEWVVKMSNG